MSDDYICAGKRKSKTDKRAKARFNRYKKGGSMRVSGGKITNGPDEENVPKKRKKKK